MATEVHAAPGPLPDPGAVAVADAPATRNALIDNARCIGIVLIVVGHAPGFPASLITWIFAFHVPLFFFLSGFVVAPHHLRGPALTRVVHLARALLVPYVFYYSISFVYWLVAKRHGLRQDEFSALPWWDPLKGLLHGTGDLMYANVTLWFFPCLFIVAVVHLMMRRRFSAGATLAIYGIVAFAFIESRPPTMARWLWSSDCALVALPFHAAGEWARTWSPRVTARWSRPLVATAGVAAALAVLGLSSIAGRVDLNNLVFGDVPWLYMPVSALGIFGVVAVSSLFAKSRVAEWLARNTIIVFPLHFLMFSVFTGVAIRVLKLDPSFKTSSLVAGLTYTVLALLLSWPAAFVIRTFFPIAIHEKRRPANVPSATSPGA